MKTQEELIKECKEKADKARKNNRIGDSYIIESNARIIESNAMNEKAVRTLTDRLKESNQKSSRLTQILIILTVVLIFLTTALIFK